MKEAVLITGHPHWYEEELSRSLLRCRVALPAQWNSTPETTRLLLVDYSALSQPGWHPDFLSPGGTCRPTVLVADRTVILETLRRGLVSFPEDHRKIPREINRLLDTALLQLEFSPSLKGYCYLKQALYYEHLNAHEISAVKKDIYESVSNCYNTSVYSVERGITFAIRKAYQSNASAFCELFRCPQKAPSNMSFLKTFYIHLQQKGYL